MLLYDHKHIIESSSGVQQGPFGPFVLLLWPHVSREPDQRARPVYNKWYMDDGGIVGDVELLSSPAARLWVCT